MISRVIVGVDFSDASKTALVTGMFWAEKLVVRESKDPVGKGGSS